jgi:FdhE protein
MNLESWLSSHPYLRTLADFHAQIDSVLVQFSNTNPSLPAWDRYIDDFHAGIPLLRSSSITIDLEPAEKILDALVGHLKVAPGKLGEECRTLQEEIHREPDASRHAVEWLIDQAGFESNCPGLLRYLGWTALSRHLQPIMMAFSNWRDDEKWFRNYCPTCGARAAMAQLLGAELGRCRLFCCSRCFTRWRYRRTGCAFCQNEDDHRLRVLTIKGEGGLRVDYCEDCRGYLKTYDGQGDEGIFLANWTSLHLDILARDRALNAFAESLFQL